jgi:type I restriction enzyme S subunit
MNAELLIAHFNRISDATDAVPHLRRFILDLAVRGKLVGQDPTDEPAAKLLERVQAEKTKRGRSERAKKASLPSETVQDSTLPTGWVWTSLADLVTVLNGRAYSQNELLTAGTPVLRVGNLFTSQHWYYSDLELNEDKYCDVGDLIFAWSASFGPFIWQGPRVIYHYHIWKLALHSDRDLDKIYLYWLLSQKTQEIKDSGHGVSMIHMTKEKMEKLKLPLPPLVEQHRIVAKIDELMALCDRLEAVRAEQNNRRDRLTAASHHHLNNGSTADTLCNHADFFIGHLPRLTAKPGQIKQLRQTILNLAVRGKLVPQDLSSQSASELLKNLKDIRSQSIAARTLKQAPEINNSISKCSGLLLPQSWTWAKCGHILFVTKLAGFEYTKYFSLHHEGEVPVIRAQNVKPWSIEKNNLVYIDRKTSELLDRSALTKPCILMTFIGAGIGDVAMFSEDARWHLAPNVAKIERFEGAEDLLDLSYLTIYLNSPFGREEIFKHLKSTAQPSISMGTIRDIDVALPPLREQQRIAAKVHELLALTNQLEAQLDTTQTEATRLLKSVLYDTLEPI